jgi:PhoPQ-activated pathogenicity-related protein
MGQFTVAQVLIALSIAIAFTPMASADLAQYIQTDDQVYRWERLSHTDRHDGLTVYELTLISQVWQGLPWEHRLRIIMPRTAPKMPPLALLLISGSGDGTLELQDGVFMARELSAPLALLYDIPNQPLFGGLMEDDLLAYTVVQFVETHDPTWPLLLPMVKGVVKAMDVVQAFMARERHTHTAGFVVSGASTRGWTTWLTPWSTSGSRRSPRACTTISTSPSRGNISGQPGGTSVGRSPHILSAVCRNACWLAIKGRRRAPPWSIPSRIASTSPSRSSSRWARTTATGRLMR